MATSKTVNSTPSPVTVSHVPKDVWIYRMVVGILGGVILTAAITAFVAIVLNKTGDTPSIAILTSLSSAAIGALAVQLVVASHNNNDDRESRNSYQKPLITVPLLPNTHNSD